MHDVPLITTIAAGFTCAWLLGLLTQRLGLSPIVGYLLAGVVIGPHTPGFVGDVAIAAQLAEVGVILLMFGVGLHFHLRDLLAVKGIAIPGAVGQSLLATLLSVFVFGELGMPARTGAVMGMAMAVASTVVLMRVLMDAEMLNTRQGHVAVGWLIVEDIFTVVLLVLIPILGMNTAPQVIGAPAAPTPELWTTVGLALLKLGALVAIVLLAGSRAVPWVLVRVARLRSRELFTLTVLVFSIAVAAASYYVFGASMALGAFLAGMVVAQSPVSHQAAADALPMRDAFAVLFFVSVGMLFDPAVLVQQPLMIAAALGIILVGKPLAALVIVAVLGHSARTALTVAIGLAQIGEFSFILSELARQHGLMPDTGHSVLVAAAILSITLNPLLFRSLPAIETWLRGHPMLWRLLNGRADQRAREVNLANQQELARQGEGDGLAVVVGYGPVGQSVHRLLHDAGRATVIVDLDIDKVAHLRARGQNAIYGDASHHDILEQAGVRRASHVMLTPTRAASRAAVVGAVRDLNGRAKILVRAQYLSERESLELAGASVVVFDEAEAAVALTRAVLADTGVQRDAAERKVHELRLHLITENMSNIRTRRVRSVMIPWTSVRRLSSQAGREEVLRQIKQAPFSRWPVVDPQSGRALGYLLTRDLMSLAPGVSDWMTLLRPLRAIRPDTDLESTLNRMQGEGAAIYQVEDGGSPVGLITLEAILEQVVGRIENEYPQAAGILLVDALIAAGVVQELTGSTTEQVIAELASALPTDKLPPGVDVGRLALEREAQISTDLGVGIAIPHARCPGLAAPLVVLGRSADGVPFSPAPVARVRLVFLLVTPAEQPEVQLLLLSQVASIAGDPVVCDRLRRATSASQITAILSESLRPTAPGA
jgi:CPA2 family monovalent cation:H+ antiporter-2